ncbi:MAG: YkgJ family cysteine cluster protein [Candidatus Thorarchaeota archaeon]
MNHVDQGKNSENGLLPHFECTKCGACCRDEFLIVTVIGSDIAKIAAVLGLGPEDMTKALDFYIIADGESIPIGLEKIPAVATEQGLAFMAIKKMENGDCIFLKEDMCMIHPVRPLVCQSFPFVLNEVEGQRTWGLSAKKEICPGLGTGLQVSENEIDELASTILPQIQMYREFTEEWNATQINPTVLELLKAILSDKRFYS